MRIVTATAQDTCAVMAIIASCIKHMKTLSIDQWNAAYPDQTLIDQDIARGALYLAKNDTSYQGMIVLDEMQPKGYEPIAWQYIGQKILVVHRLAVDPQCQGKGMASQLMDFAEEFGRQGKYDAVRLDAFVHNPAAVRLYQKRGYQLAGTFTARERLFYCFEKSLMIEPKNV